MEIKLTENEETGSTHYYALQLEVEDSGKTHIVNATLAENYDSNSGFYDHSVDMVEFESDTAGLSASDAEKIIEEVKGCILKNVDEITGAIREV